MKPIRKLLFVLPLASALVFAQDANAQKQTARSDSEQNKSQSQTSTQTTERDRPLTKEQTSTQTSDRDRTRTESETATQTSDKDRTRTESQSQAQPPSSQPEDSSKGTASRTETASSSWRGTLVDANCNAAGMMGGSNAIKSNTGTEPNSSADRHQNTANTGETVPGQTPEHTATGTPRGGKDFARKCPVSNSTTAFALVTADGQFYKFDESGNSKVTAMLGGGSSDSSNRNLKKGKNKRVSVSGSLQGNTIKVDSVM